MATALVVLSGCSPGQAGGGLQQPASQPQPVSTTQPGGSPAGGGLPTGNWSTTGTMMAALLEGVLIAGRDGCLYVRPSWMPQTSPEPSNDDASFSLVIWPKGFTTLGSYEEGVTVIDTDGNEVARTGDNVRLGGGFGIDPYPGTEHCTDHPESPAFSGVPG